MLLVAVLVLVATFGAVPAEVNQQFDISDVVFQDAEIYTGVCTEDYPMNVTITDISSDAVSIIWNIVTNTTNITSYQVLFWEATSTQYNNITVGVVTEYTIENLRPFTNYFVSVRGTCSVGFGLASAKEDFLTLSTYPSSAPIIGKDPKITLGSGSDNSSVTITWTGLTEEMWNGIPYNYIITITDITPRFNLDMSFNVHPDDRYLVINKLKEGHTYLVTVAAVSTGGQGPMSNPVMFKIEKPPEPSSSTNPEYVNYWYFLAVPAGILVAVVIAVCVVCIKVKYEKTKRGVRYVNDVSANNTKFIGDDFSQAQRMDSTRASFSTRPLPAFPQESHPRTPSVSSMSARLIDHNSPMTPNAFQRGMSFSNADHTHFHHPPHSASHIGQPLHQPDLLPSMEMDLTHHQIRNASVTSPHVPQLSQPLSDFSNPSSVFTESNGPNAGDDNASSPNTPKAYEVPSDSKTCHQSVSPVMSAGNTNTLPNMRRPHTATGVMSSQPMLPRHPQSSHSPVSLTHSSSDVRVNNAMGMVGGRPPDVPPHRSGPSVIMERDLTSPPTGFRPESGLYSEIADSNVDSFPQISPPADSTLGRGYTLPKEGSVISSDRYSDYSDIPSAVGPPTHMVKGGRSRQRNLPSVEEYRSGSLSDSMSSYSSDSRSNSPGPSKMGGDLAPGMFKTPFPIPLADEHDYDETNSVVGSQIGNTTDNTRHPTKPNPYLSPVDIVSSNSSSMNGHTPSD